MEGASEEIQRPRLSPWYLNTSRLSLLTDLPIADYAAAQVSLSKNSYERVEAMRHAGAFAAGALYNGSIPTLLETGLTDQPGAPAVLASHWGSFTMRGVLRAFYRERQGLRYEPGAITGELDLGDELYPISGMLFNQHFYSESSTHTLSGKRKLLVTGEYSFDGRRIQVYPYIVGDLVTHADFLPMPWRSQVRVHPEDIDAFADMKGVRAPKRDQLAILRQTPEEAVKAAIADMIGEPFVPKDWGGEKSDLTTSRLTIAGRSITAAFIFKGPGTPGEMHPASMGKRGDQLLRAFEEPVDLVVVQHHDKIATSVIRMAEALASDIKRPRRFCILDGADTYRLLKAYGRLPTR